jgi:multidrug efflux pump subunit AcrA (membrane-fusion protein)
MTGEVVATSSQAASEKSERGLPKFPVTARIAALTPAHRQNVRIGMSAYLDIQTREKPDALIVPAEAVHSGEGGAWVFMRDRDSGTVRKIEVTTGPTTIEGVEILSGLEPGDVIILGSADGPQS